MDMAQVEYAAQMFFMMCREHPEICPHDYSWSGTIIDNMNNCEIKKYVCGLCGHEMKERVDL